MDKVDNRHSPLELPGCGAVLGLFAKEPRPGRVKTRLSPPLSPIEACALYRMALAESVSRFSTAAPRPVLCWAGRRAWFARAFPGLPLTPQGRGDLGARLARTIAVLFATGGSSVGVVGSDSPDLPPALIDEAFAALADVDAAAIPGEDGGFVLLALRRPAPELFTGIPWSTPVVLEAVRHRAELLGLSFATVGSWDDVDDLPSLCRLVQRSPECATARYARAYLRSRLPL